VRIASLPTQAINVVSLAGAVKHPGPYEFRPGMRVSDLVKPDQLLVDAYADQAEIIRTDPVTYQSKVIPFSPSALFQGDKAEDHVLQRLDQVVVSTQLRRPNLVQVEGEVRRPGRFTIQVGERLSSVLKRAGGLTSQAYPQGILLIRPSVRRAQQNEVERFVILQKQKLLSESAAFAAGGVGVPGVGAMAGSPEQAVLQMQLQALDQLAARVQPGRVVVRMESIAQLEHTLDDIVLEDGDQITMPPVPNTVNVIGAVRNPSTVVYEEGIGVDAYLKRAGGTMETAKEKDIYILRANGSSDQAYGKFRTIARGDTIVVPEELEAKTRPLPLWTAIASILGSIMLAVAAVTVIGTR
jgi:polysaccharide biosynthesis/export protein